MSVWGIQEIVNMPTVPLPLCPLSTKTNRMDASLEETIKTPGFFRLLFFLPEVSVRIKTLLKSSIGLSKVMLPDQDCHVFVFSL